MTERRLVDALLAVLGVGLIATALSLAVLVAAVRSNKDAINDGERSGVTQQAEIQQARAEAAEAKADAEEARRSEGQLSLLVQALQDQVRRLGGTPLQQSPSPRTSAGDRPSDGASSGSTSGTTRPTPAPTRSPRPSSTPRPTPTPSPSPSPSQVCLFEPICLPIPPGVSR